MAASPFLHGQCFCGNIQVDVEVTYETTGFSPRACDCSFCQAHGAAYVSDPRGKLQIRCGSYGVTSFQQGGDTDSQASFYFCSRCGVLTHVLHHLHDAVDSTVTKSIGAINYRIIPNFAQVFASPVAVSPRTLTTAEKIERWQANWFPAVDVLLSSESHGSA